MGTKRRPATEAEARALASAVRLRILRLCLDQALTNKEIAGRLDANPATTLHHVRKLVETGFLGAEPSRPGPRGSTEIPYRATGKSWEMDVRESGVMGGRAAMLNAFLEEIKLVDVEESDFTRLGLRLTAEGLAELQGRLQEVFEEFRERPPSPDGEAYSLFVALHRDVARDA
ncbi:winged helix-turn-helix transcriptional regulator [Nonomuraea turkmeniaca]|uniref:Winged helix-turn-helix transcriptional regulator n=1 Tax=Nonomuraea turkmeniaca TaxID=103838 RepID=A0A5S4FFY9_9ACTN|nr:winged helix-turn-helix domain-containing protein [Nonomuraea turkmeniaca]TMR18350.1 winged helix-turn-helix transcriptional regulator [Nonomuraea turkmeniaca]